MSLAQRLNRRQAVERIIRAQKRLAALNIEHFKLRDSIYALEERVNQVSGELTYLLNCIEEIE